MPQGCSSRTAATPYDLQFSKFIGQFLEQTTAGFDIFINGGGPRSLGNGQIVIAFV